MQHSPFTWHFANKRQWRQSKNNTIDALVYELYRLTENEIKFVKDPSK